MDDERQERLLLRREFDRVAGSFAERTRNRFDDLGVVGFSAVKPGDRVLEVGAGTGNFIRHFEGIAGTLVALDLSPRMLEVGRAAHPALVPVVGDGARLPFASRAFDLAASAQALHHVRDPMPFVREMRRVVRPTGTLLVVDQIATESYEEMVVRHQLEVLRDPSHAMTRAASSIFIMLRAAGMRIVEEKTVTSRSKLSEWMWPGEYPPERIEAVRRFIEQFGHLTGMEWEREGDDWVYTRRRLMVLATRDAS